MNDRDLKLVTKRKVIEYPSVATVLRSAGFKERPAVDALDAIRRICDAHGRLIRECFE